MWNCEAKATKRRSGRLKRGKEKGALGKGTSLSPGLQSHKNILGAFGMVFMGLGEVLGSVPFPRFLEAIPILC